MSVSVIVVGFGDEPVLEECLSSIEAQLGPDDDLMLVDHGITSPLLCDTRTVVRLHNRGFGAGCAAGALATSGDNLVFVNSDAVLLPGALHAITLPLGDQSIGLVAGCVVFADRPEMVNSAGLPVHLTGLSWSAGYGDPIDQHQVPRDVTSVAGAFFACRRAVWTQLEGMDESYFLYHEDTDLSLRCHLAGLRVVYRPDAIARHTYDFSRNAGKMFFLERNRFVTVVGDFPIHLLLRVVPVMLILEPLYVVIALRDGWGQEKLRAWGWLARNAGSVARRRRRVQGQVRDPHALDALLAPVITQTQLAPPRGLSLINRGLTLYWRLARPKAGSAA